MRYARPFFRSSRFLDGLPLAIRWGFAVLFFVGMAWLYRRYSLTYVADSDYANSLLQGDAIAHGNVLLNHWVMTTVSYYTTDALLYGVGVLLRGFDAVLLHEIPVAVYLGVLVSAMVLATNAATRRAKRNIWGAVVVFALIGLPCRLMGWHFLMGPARMTTVLYMLLMFLLLDTPNDAPRVSVPRLLGFGALLTWALIADDFPRYVVIVPVLLFATLRVWHNQAAWKTEAPFVGVAIGSVIATKIAYAAMQLAGTYGLTTIFSPTRNVIPLNDLPLHLLRTVESLQKLYDAGFWGEELRAGLVLRVLLCSLPLLLCFAFAHVATRITKRAGGIGRLDRVSTYLALGMGMNLLAYTLTNATEGLTTTRYLVPFCVFGAVLLGRGVTRGVFARRRTRVLTVYASLLGAVCALPSFYQGAFTPFTDPPARQLGEWLAANNLRDGYGTYWSAAEVTARSGNRVRVRPLTWRSVDYHAFIWGVDSRWFAPGIPANFVVVEARGLGQPLATLEKQFGKPIRTENRFGYVVLIYDHDISPQLIVDAVVP